MRRAAPLPIRGAVALGIVVVGALPTVTAQGFKDLHTPKSPLVLKAQGSFLVGGETVAETAIESGQASDGHAIVNPMYVRYMVPKDGKKAPVVLVHGASLTGKNYETQPDGRMGWDEYFVRKGHAVYVADQASRARSGFDTAVFNKVRAGLLPPSALPAMFKVTKEAAWGAFRFGPKFGVPHPDGQFPVAVADEMVKQGVPTLNALLPTPDPSYKALADLAVDLGGAVLVGHSQGGGFPMYAALANPRGIRGLVMIEGGCSLAGLSDQQVATLATLPILAVWGDHLDQDTGIPGFSWKASFDQCKIFLDTIRAKGGDAQLLHPPDQGIFGNSHMLMNDKNSDQIADLIMKWIDRHASKKGSVR